MKHIMACAAPITAHMGLVATLGSGKQAVKVRMHPAQVASISMLYVTVAVDQSMSEFRSLEEIDAVRHLAKDYAPSTFLGIEIEQDPAMLESRMDFLDETGEVIGRIDNLAIPNGFAVNA